MGKGHSIFRWFSCLIFFLLFGILMGIIRKIKLNGILYLDKVFNYGQVTENSNQVSLFHLMKRMCSMRDPCFLGLQW